MTHITLVGYYGAGNFGDELMLEGILSTLPPGVSVSILSLGGTSLEGCPEDVAIQECRSIRGGGSLLRNMKVFFTMYRILRSSDLLIFGGGTIFFDRVKRGFSNLFGPLKIVLTAWLLRPRIIIFGCGIEPLSSPTARKIVRFILLRCQSIFLRDHHSVTLGNHLLSSCRVAPPITRVPDPAYLVRCRTPGPTPPGERQKHIVFCLMETSFRETGFFQEKPFLEILREGITRAVARGYTILLLPMQQDMLRNDHRVHQGLYSRLDDRERTKVKLLDKVSYTRKKILLRQSRMIVSMRYHPLIMAHMTGTPFCTLSVSGKTREFAERVAGGKYLVNLGEANWKTALRRELFSFLSSPPETFSTADEERIAVRIYASEMIAPIRDHHTPVG